MARTVTLLNQLAQEKKENPNRIKAIFALERIVARLENNQKLSESLVYKGGYALYKTMPTDRLTRDVDALAHSISPEITKKLILKSLHIDLIDDIYFHDIQITDLETTGDYGGIRIDTAFSINQANIKDEKIKKLSRVHLDIGFGNLFEKTKKIPMAAMIEEEKFKVSWSILPLEYIFAEKLQTLVIRGSANSRSKDVYDMWLISKNLSGNKDLELAIASVFEDRNTPKPDSFSAFITNLDKTVLQSAWSSILFSEFPVTFEKAIEELIDFFVGIEN